MDNTAVQCSYNVETRNTTNHLIKIIHRPHPKPKDIDPLLFVEPLENKQQEYNNTQRQAPPPATPTVFESNKKSLTELIASNIQGQDHMLMDLPFLQLIDELNNKIDPLTHQTSSELLDIYNRFNQSLITTLLKPVLTPEITMMNTTRHSSLSGLITSQSTDNRLKLAQSVFMIVFTLTVFWFNKNMSGHRIIAWLMIVYFTKYFITFITLYFSANKLHWVNVITTKLDGFGLLSFPFQIEYHPSQIIYSISQLSSIRGSNVHIALYNMTTTNALLLFSSVAFKWYELQNNKNNWSWTDHQHLSLIFGLTTAFGIRLVGVWELSPYSKVHVIMHYFGILGLMTLPVALLLQSEFSILSILLCTLISLLWVVYEVSSTLCFKDTENENGVHHQRVHLASFVFITMETIAWISLACGIVVFVFKLD
eukprot:130776_1